MTSRTNAKQIKAWPFHRSFKCVSFFSMKLNEIERESVVILSLICEGDDGHGASCWMGMQPLTRLLVADVDVKPQNDDVGEESCPPVNDEHHHAAQYGSSQGNPHVVVFEAGAPS